MVDFLKANPSITVEEYKWKLTVPMIRLMSSDFTRVKYLTDAEIEAQKYKHVSAPQELLNDFNIPVLSSKL
jgi:hypothetical protein